MTISGLFAKSLRVKVKGRNNIVQFEKGLTKINNSSVVIYGDNNHILVKSGCRLRNVSFYIESSNGTIIIGNNTTITGNTHLAVIEGRKIEIGQRCLFSQDISLRTGDSHSIIDKNGNRTNPSKDIKIGNHVWIGHSVNILKGAVIGDDSVVATGSILSGKEFPSNCIIGGIGGKVLKENINWLEERIPCSGQDDKVN